MLGFGYSPLLHHSWLRLEVGVCGYRCCLYLAFPCWVLRRVHLGKGNGVDGGYVWVRVLPQPFSAGTCGPCLGMGFYVSSAFSAGFVACVFLYGSPPYPAIRGLCWWCLVRCGFCAKPALHGWVGSVDWCFPPFLAGVRSCPVWGGWSLTGPGLEYYRVRWFLNITGEVPCGCLSLPLFGGCRHLLWGGPRLVPGGVLWVLVSAFLRCGFAQANVGAVVCPLWWWALWVLPPTFPGSDLSLGAGGRGSCGCGLWFFLVAGCCWLWWVVSRIPSVHPLWMLSLVPHSLKFESLGGVFVRLFGFVAVAIAAPCLPWLVDLS